MLFTLSILLGAAHLFLNQIRWLDRDQELVCAAEDPGVSLGRCVLHTLKLAPHTPADRGVGRYDIDK